MKTFTVLLITLGVAAAAREESLKVVYKLRELQPKYRDSMMFEVDAVAKSKRSVADIINDFQTEVVKSKESYLRSAITQEEKLKEQINDTSENCSSLVNDKVNKEMELAGFKFSSCILVIDEKLNKEISAVYANLDDNSGSPRNIRIYEAFQGNNIFQNPEDIYESLQQKLVELENLPTSLPAKLQQYVDGFKNNLPLIIDHYKECLSKNDDLLVKAFAVALEQLNTICKEK